MIPDKVQRHRLQIKWNESVFPTKVGLTKRRSALLNAGLPFEGAIDDGTLMYTAAAIRPAERDVHHEIESPEGLATFRRSPHHGHADARDQTFYKVAPCGAELDLV